MNSNLYLITGDETFEKNEVLEKIKNSFDEELVKGINYITLDSNSIFNLENEINTYPFGFSKKLIIVRVEKKEKDKKEKKDEEEKKDKEENSIEKEDWFNESLENVLEKMTDVVVAFYGEFQKRSRIYKFIEKNGKVIICEKKKNYELLSWSKKFFDDEKIKISSSDLTYLVEICGNDKLFLKNEIDKLVSYGIFNKKISKEEIDALCIRNSDVIIFELTDSLATKNTKRSLELLNELLKNKESIQMITIMIARHFKSLLVAKMALANNKNVSDELRGKSPYACSKYTNQSKLFSIEEIVNIIRSLAKIDISSKTGLIDLRIGLENVICM